MIAPADAAREILGCCLRGERWPAESLARLVARALEPSTAAQASRALFEILVEGLSDRFEPRLAAVYAELFSEVASSALPEWTAEQLVARHRRVRAPRRFEAAPIEFAMSSCCRA